MTEIPLILNPSKLDTLHAEFLFMLTYFTWLTNDLLKDDPPLSSAYQFQPLKIACCENSAKPKHLGIVRACEDKSPLLNRGYNMAA